MFTGVYYNKLLGGYLGLCDTQLDTVSDSRLNENIFPLLILTHITVINPNPYTLQQPSINLNTCSCFGQVSQASMYTLSPELNCFLEAIISRNYFTTVGLQ